MRQGVPLTSYFLALFSLLVPIIFGTFNYRKLTLPLIYILIFLIFGLIYSITQVYLKNPLSYNIQFYIFHLLFNLFYSLVFFHWAEIRKVNIYVILQLLIYFSSVIIEVYIIGLSSFRISIAVVINQIFYCLFAVYLINKILSNEDSKVERRVKLLVLIPFFVFYTYMNIIGTKRLKRAKKELVKGTPCLINYAFNGEAGGHSGGHLSPTKACQKLRLLI